jgi:hypothetical protein
VKKYTIVALALVLLVSVNVFADMDASRFYQAINIHLINAEYGIVIVSALQDVDASEDENGDGFIYVADGNALFQMDYYIVNARTKQFVMIRLSNLSEFPDTVDQNMVKVYRLSYSNLKEQFIKEIDNARREIGLRTGN